MAVFRNGRNTCFEHSLRPINKEELHSLLDNNSNVRSVCIFGVAEAEGKIDFTIEIINNLA